MEGIDIYERLPQAPVAVPAARAALTPLEGAVDPNTFETLRLLVSELVGNSVRHASEEANENIELSVDASREAIRVEVSDGGGGFDATPRGEDADQASGWGLHLLDSLSDRWGTERNGRMRVWFELVDSGAFALGTREEPAGSFSLSSQRLGASSVL
jgi:LytS/YehU family sensor histidine kinase